MRILATLTVYTLACVPLFAPSWAFGQIPADERAALIALYNSTDGANWLEKANWLGPVGTECTWQGVICSWRGNVEELDLRHNQLNGVIPSEIGDLSALVTLRLNWNQLSGSIPPELGNLSILSYLYLPNNQLSGVIPAELGNLESLTYLYLSDNELTGGIPPELGDLSNLEAIWIASNQLSGSIPSWLGGMGSLRSVQLNSNRLSGEIPAGLGGLSNLEQLILNSNQLHGEIPTSLGNLHALREQTGLDLRWNALHSDNATLIAFLNSKQVTEGGGTLLGTQTIPPKNLAVDSVGDHTVWLSWDAVSYQSDPGGYEVFYSPTGSGVWTSGGWTEAKTETSYPVTGLDPGEGYDFAVASITYPHINNLNVVNSDFSSEVMATTATVGCPKPVIMITWGDPIALTVPGAYDSYLWVTGEATETITVNPLWERWYWATVTSAGPCEETASRSVNPDATVFADGFESGNTSAWSSFDGENCAHDPCQTGLALDPSCNPCVAQICAVDDYCCNVAWDRTCVDQVASVCGLTCN